MTTREQIDCFLSLFRGRPDVHAVRWENAATGRTGYRPVDGSLNQALVHTHVSGERVLGVYPLLDDDTTWFLVADLDGPRAVTEARELYQAFQLRGLPCYLERSRSGGAHLWMFFQHPVPAHLALACGRRIASTLTGRLASWDRFYPTRERHAGEKRLGNLIALPLQGEAVSRGNSVFLSPESWEPAPDQWQFLAAIQRTNRIDVEAVLGDPAPEALLLPFTRKRISPSPTEALRVTLREALEIACPCPPEVASFLESRAVFDNPEWFRRKQLMMFLGKTPRRVRCGGVVDDRWIAPIGVWPELEAFLHDKRISCSVDDQRACPSPVSFAPTAEHSLRRDQMEQVLRVLPRTNAVLVAPTGSGKTQVALELIHRRQVPALVLVHTRALVEQWSERLNRNLDVPKTEIGRVRAGKLRLGARVTVATYQSLAPLDLQPWERAWGMVIVDECHRASAPNFLAVIRQLAPRFLLGLTATPKRRDHLERLLFLHLGPPMKSTTPRELSALGVITLPEVEVVRTQREFGAYDNFSKLMDVITVDSGRNSVITATIHRAAQDGHQVLVVTDRLDHCHLLGGALKTLGHGVLSGAADQKTRRAILDEFKAGSLQVLLATPRLLGEGWDCPLLSALILATPMSGASRLEQILGRLMRTDPEKAPPRVYDFYDQDGETLERMFKKRLAVYRKSLGNSRLPEEFRLTKTQRPAAVLNRAPRVGPRRVPVVEGQLELFP